MPDNIDSTSRVSGSSRDGSVKPLAEKQPIEEEAASPPPSAVSAPPNQPPPPPDGGFKAWVQVAGSFFLILNCWGIVNTFGV